MKLRAWGSVIGQRQGAAAVRGCSLYANLGLTRTPWGARVHGRWSVQRNVRDVYGSAKEMKSSRDEKHTRWWRWRAFVAQPSSSPHLAAVTDEPPAHQRLTHACPHNRLCRPFIPNFTNLTVLGVRDFADGRVVSFLSTPEQVYYSVLVLTHPVPPKQFLWGWVERGYLFLRATYPALRFNGTSADIGVVPPSASPT